MEDVYRSLFVVLPVGAVIAIIFILNARKKKETHLRLEEYCKQRGYQMDEVRQRLHQAVIIHGDGWRLTTGVQSSDVESQSGAANTIDYTEWSTVSREVEYSPVLWLGTVPRSAVFLDDNFLPLLSMFGIRSAESMHAIALEGPLQERFTVIAKESPAQSQAGADMARLLEDWPEKWPLRVALGMSSAQLRIPGMKFDKPQDLDRIITLGTGLHRCRECHNAQKNDE